MIVGIDEVGRGCLAGPVVAGAVVLKRSFSGLKDSKKLTKLQRTEMDIIIRRRAISFALGWADVNEINELGLTAAIGLAMRRALEQIAIEYDEIIIDGNYNFLLDLPGSRALVAADDKIPAVSAASIVAKVARDNFMREQALLYPHYSFDEHVGYGTRKHRAAIQEHGICDLHRLSFAPVRLALGEV